MSTRRVTPKRPRPRTLATSTSLAARTPSPTPTARERARREANNRRFLAIRYGLAEIRTQSEAAGAVGGLMMDASELSREVLRLEYARVGALALAKQFEVDAEGAEGLMYPVEEGFEILQGHADRLTERLALVAKALYRTERLK